MTKCIVCGCLYEPIRKNQPCCLSEECKRQWRKIYTKQYAKRNRQVRGVSKQEYKREKAREYRAKARGEVYVPNFEPKEPKREPIADASDYATKQRAKTLAMVGKVQI